MHDYRFWYFLRHPDSLTYILDKELDSYKIKGYIKNVAVLLILTMLLFAIRDVWGMYTVRFTEIFVSNKQDQYIFARYVSFLGAILMGAVYFAFHYYVVPCFLSILTDLPYRWIQKVQLYVIVYLLIEKLLTFAIFRIVGFTTLFSPFSSAAIWTQFVPNSWFLFFMNQLTVATILTITLQYKFLVQWDVESKKILLAKIILLQLLFAAVIATISISPITQWALRGLN